MELRGRIAQQLNVFSSNILAASNKLLRDPINISQARSNRTYDRCEHIYNIAAGAPANFQSEPCIYEEDSVKELGPFTDPQSGGGYPNYSFFLPGDAWLPGLLVMLTEWLQKNRGAYPALLHPNTGCEVRDHMEEASIQWLGPRYPLLSSIFQCRALGCNQACQEAPHHLPPAACP